MKTSQKFCMLLVITIVMTSLSHTSLAQEKRKPVTYLLPGGKVFNLEKWDSLEQAWGKGKITLIHSMKDDGNGVIHLARVTDEMIQQQLKQKSEMESAFASMLNQPAPEFTLTDMQGHRWSLNELRGKIVVLNFWFTSCAPCIQELPELNTLAYMYGAESTVFLGLTFNDADKVEAFSKKHKFDYHLLPDSKVVDEQYHVKAWPTSIVIDKQGYIRKIILSSAKIREELGSAIEEAK